AGLNPVTTNDAVSGAITSVRFDHAWLNVQMPGPDGLQFRTIDPAFKSIQVSATQSFTGAMSFDVTAAVAPKHVSTGEISFDPAIPLNRNLLVMQGSGRAANAAGRTVWLTETITELVHVSPLLNGTVTAVVRRNSSGTVPLRVIGRKTRSTELGVRFDGSKPVLYRTVNGIETVLAQSNVSSVGSDGWLRITMNLTGSQVMVIVSGEPVSDGGVVSLSADLNNIIGDAATIEEGTFGVILSGSAAEPVSLDSLKIDGVAAV
ncbi:MAG: hypothetical protein ACK58T_47360, partial [Phycisphaerae bacterium]